MGKQRAIKLSLDNTFEEKRFKTDQNKIKDGKKETMFEPICVFHEKKPSRLKFWKGRRSIVFFVDGAFKALRFGKATKDMNPFWTQKESDQFAKRTIRKSLEELKPIKWSQFIILCVFLAVILGVLLSIAQRVGVF